MIEEKVGNYNNEICQIYRIIEVLLEHDNVNSDDIIKYQCFEMHQKSTSGEKLHSMTTKVWSDAKFTSGPIAWVEPR